MESSKIQAIRGRGLKGAWLTDIKELDRVGENLQELRVLVHWELRGNAAGARVRTMYDDLQIGNIWCSHHDREL